MKTTVTTQALFRFLPAACLAAGLLTTPCLANAGNAALARSVTAPVKELPPVSTNMFEEIADRAKQEALFGAQIIPRIALLFDSPQHLVSLLWQLRSVPAIQTEWLDKLANLDRTDEERAEALKNLEQFLDDIHKLARQMPRHPDTYKNVWERFHSRYTSHSPKSQKPVRDRHDPEHLARILKRTKRVEAFFTKALILNDTAGKAGISKDAVARFAPELLKIKNSPDALQLANTLVCNENIPDELVRHFLARLATDPAAAREEIATHVKRVTLEANYDFVQEEGTYSFIQLPLSAILPDAVSAVEKTGTLPLASGAVEGAKDALAFKQLERLFPEGFNPKDAKAVPPILSEGERLYVILYGMPGTPVFAGTPLETLADAGPVVTEYSPQTAENIFLELHSGEHVLGAFFMAAKCGPEELAAHLGSLGLMVSAREKSLYGPHDDFVWNEKDPRHPLSRSGTTGEKPADIPGEALRFTQLGNSAMFLILAPLADSKGLERLMGPIRSVWVKSYGQYDPIPWTEMRYTPAEQAVTPFALGASPVLQLGNDALDALNAQQEADLVRSWTNYTLRDCANQQEKALCIEQYPATVTDVEKKFSNIREKGFVSPLDISESLYFMEEYATDTPTLEKLRAVLDDTSLSSAKRVAAMREITGTR